MKLVLSKLLKNKSAKGFTLIELLVVIAILGILAAVVLVGVNPLEQLKRGRDSSRKTVIAQLGHAMESYATAQATTVGAASYPSNSASWMSTLLSASEIKSLATLPTAGTGANCISNSMQTGTNVCYASLNSTTAVIWTFTEADASKNLCPTSPNTLAAAAWISGQGKAGIDCLSTTASVPAAADPLL